MKKEKLSNEEFKVLVGVFKPIMGLEAVEANLKAGGTWVINNIKVTYEDNGFVATING